MLAQNFKTPDELRISSAQYDALIGVMRMLELDELRHVPWDHFEDEEWSGFNMGEYLNSCGSVACIAGWCDKLYKTRFRFGEGVTEALDNLFHMNGQSWDRMKETSPAEAASAIRNYLTTGDPCWESVIQD